MRYTPSGFPQTGNPADFQIAITEAMAELQIEETTAVVLRTEGTDQ
ncbi:hypothetical protein [Streptomyces sp. NPDC056056]